MRIVVLVIRHAWIDRARHHVGYRATAKVAIEADGEVAEVLDGGAWGGKDGWCQGHDGCEGSGGSDGETHSLFFKGEEAVKEKFFLRDVFGVSWRREGGILLGVEVNR
jgi:hypothetical protein